MSEPEPEFRAFPDADAAQVPDPRPDAPPEPRAPGLGSLHATLDRLIQTLGLRSLTVVVDDPDLGRQAFRAGPGPFEPGTLAGRSGCRSDPPLPAERVDEQLLTDLCATSLRLEVLRADSAEGEGLDAAELALRRLPGVHAVVVEHDGDLMVVQVHAGPDATPDLARAAAHAAAPLAEARVVVEVVRDEGAPPPTPSPPAPVARESSETAASLPVAPRGPEAAIVAVRSDSEAGEVEVHVRSGDVRTIGRAPMTQGLAGAVNATLDALRGVNPKFDFGLGWARTIETTAERRFVVAVGLLHPGTRASRHGLATADSPIEAAAHATLDAVQRGGPEEG